MTGLVAKVSIGLLLLFAVYFLLVYYKGGTAYVGAASTAFNSGAGQILGAAKQGYAK